MTTLHAILSQPKRVTWWPASSWINLEKKLLELITTQHSYPHTTVFRRSCWEKKNATNYLRDFIKTGDMKPYLPAANQCRLWDSTSQDLWMRFLSVLDLILCQEAAICTHILRRVFVVYSIRCFMSSRCVAQPIKSKCERISRVYVLVLFRQWPCHPLSPNAFLMICLPMRMHNAVNERRIMLLLFVIFRIMDRACIMKSFWKSLALGVKEFIWVYRVLNALIRFASMDHFVTYWNYLPPFVAQVEWNRCCWCRWPMHTWPLVIWSFNVMFNCQKCNT